MILEAMSKSAASFQGFYRTSVVRLDYLLILYSFFHDFEGTVKLLSRVRGEDQRNLRATVSQIFPSIRNCDWLFPKQPWNNCFITQLFKNNTVNSTPTFVVDVGHSRYLSIRHHRFHRKQPFCLSPYWSMTSCRNYSVKVNFTSKFG